METNKNANYNNKKHSQICYIKNTHKIKKLENNNLSDSKNQSTLYKKVIQKFNNPIETSSSRNFEARQIQSFNINKKRCIVHQNEQNYSKKLNNTDNNLLDYNSYYHKKINQGIENLRNKTFNKNENKVLINENENIKNQLSVFNNLLLEITETLLNTSNEIKNKNKIDIELNNTLNQINSLLNRTDSFKDLFDIAKIGHEEMINMVNNININSENKLNKIIKELFEIYLEDFIDKNNQIRYEKITNNDELIYNDSISKLNEIESKYKELDIKYNNIININIDLENKIDTLKETQKYLKENYNKVNNLFLDVPNYDLSSMNKMKQELIRKNAIVKYMENLIKNSGTNISKLNDNFYLKKFIKFQQEEKLNLAKNLHEEMNQINNYIKNSACNITFSQGTVNKKDYKNIKAEKEKSLKIINEIKELDIEIQEIQNKLNKLSKIY